MILETIANTWNCIARDMIASAQRGHDMTTRQSLVASASRVFAATGNREWNTDVRIEFSDDDIVTGYAINRGAR